MEGRFFCCWFQFQLISDSRPIGTFYNLWTKLAIAQSLQIHLVLFTSPLINQFYRAVSCSVLLYTLHFTFLLLNGLFYIFALSYILLLTAWSVEQDTITAYIQTIAPVILLHMFHFNFFQEQIYLRNLGSTYGDESFAFNSG